MQVTYIHIHAHAFPFLSYNVKIQEDFLDRFEYPSYLLDRMNKSLLAKRERVNRTVYIKYFIPRG